MSKVSRLTYERAHELFTYNPSTGGLIRKSNGKGTAKAGDVVGSPDMDGYLLVSIDNTTHRVHRVIWLMVTGRLPESQIDHINGETADNRWANLRGVSVEENHKNMKKSRRNVSGVVGVSFNKRDKRWRADIGAGPGKRAIYLGYFKTKAEAVAVRKAAEKKHGYHPNHGREV